MKPEKSPAKTALPDGYCGRSDIPPLKFHFFLEGDQRCLCGGIDADTVTGDPEVRRPGGMDCSTCAEIYEELYSPKPPAAPAAAWTVKTCPVEHHHTLYFQGKPQSCVRGTAGLATQNELAAIFNRNGTLPKGKKVRCAADAPDAGKYLAKNAAKSTPELSLSQPIKQPPTTMTTKAKPFTSPPVDVAMPPVEEIPASNFRRAADNRTISAEQITKMSDSIREVGVLQPITARRVEDADPLMPQLEIVLGECRWRGCSDIDEHYLVPCFVRKLSDKDASKIRAIENFQRKDLDEIEEARAIQNLKDTGWTVEEITNFLGRKKDHIYQRLTLLRLSDDAHAALREGNISIGTACKLASLPDEQRADALQAVVSPTHAAKSLPERDALRLLDEQFVEPQKRSDEWESRKSAILENYPGAKWLPYAEARKLGAWNSGYTRAENQPAYSLLSDAASAGELVVPTWRELAAKHGAQLVIGCNYGTEAEAYVQPEPLIDAEKTACSEKPNECIFVHEAAVHQARADAERRKLEMQAFMDAVSAERMKLASMVLAPEGMNKTIAKKLVEMSFLDTASGYCEIEEYAGVFGIDMAPEDAVEKTEAAILKYLRTKTLTPFEASARLVTASWIVNAFNRETLCAVLFGSGLAKPADCPCLYEEHSKNVAREAKRELEKQLTSDAAKEEAA